MSKRRHSLVTGLTVTALLAGMVYADAATKKRKLGFFERMFISSSPKRPQVQRNSAFRFWKNNDGVSVIYGNRVPNEQQFYDSDPEPLPTLGMGNLDYVGPKTVSIFDPKAAKALTSTAAADAIRQEFADKKIQIRTLAKNRDAIIAHYAQTSYRPIWMLDGKLTDRAKQVLQHMASANTEGLLPHHYLPTLLPDVSDASLSVTFEPKDAASLDIDLTRAALLYARHVSSGLFEPNKLSLYHDITPEVTAPESVLRVLAYTPFPAAYMQTLVPKHAAYAVLKNQLAVLESSISASPHVPFETTGQRVKAGQRDARIPDLRKRMLDAGLLEPGDALVTETARELLDKSLSKALKDFQTSNGLKATGNLDKPTEVVLSIDPRQRQRDKLAINLERLRWIPKDLGNRNVLVNQAGFEVVVTANNAEVWRSNVIVGRPMTQTAVFSDTMETVVFNPSWGVPQSIIVNEYMPKLRRDPGYLDRMGFKVVNSAGKVVSSRSVNWGAYGNKPPFGVQQPPGVENALGEIKFLFPNSHDIYMHDTPTRNLFSETSRAFSHGCVRVQNPREFATVLLNWSRDSVDQRVEGGESSSVKLPSPYRVHLTYFTAWPDKNGKVAYHSDFYGRDAKMLDALAVMRKRARQIETVSLMDQTNGSGQKTVQE